MPRFLADLLGTDHPLFTRTLYEFEQAAGNSGVDTRLIADITERAHSIMRRLGLDPADTPGEELYHALNASVRAGRAEQLLRDSHYALLRFSDGLISFCLHDVIENAHHELPYEKRLIGHAQRHLRAEIVRRYAEHDRTDDDMVYRMASQAGLKRSTDDEYPEVQPSFSSAKTSVPYVLAVGDIITDAFIKLSEEHAEVTTDEKGYKLLSFELGAKLPYDEVEIIEAVECSPNAAVSMTRLGLEVSLMSWLGDDEPGKSMIRYLKQQGVGTESLVVEKGMKSNYHYVLRYGADRTKLQKFENYSYGWREPARKPDWLYLGVLGEQTWPLHEAILGYLSDNPDIKLVFQPGMYHLMWGTEKMKPFYERAEIVIMNREEAAEVTGKDRGDIDDLLQSLHNLGVSVAVVTDGADGAYASDSQSRLFMPNYPDPKPPLDRTGAGDAFASTIAAALALGESLETALRWAPINSMSVVQHMGAQAGLLHTSEVKAYLASAPANYNAKDIE
ncbi:Sugar kinase, ribokinase family [Candidatus Saccharibacteria bacterium RAAC3_TM7_1]|nr:Sugar kinase, ribokinase family [Candidatus Saccharibacteria bacterium RAAC3_TM7_1]HCZ28886.1 carbohydrate kinase family protein [Candidatus Saccharibacteria bacterium]